MRRALAAVLVLVFALALVIAVRTAGFTSRQPPAEAISLPAPPDGAAERLAEALRFRTVSHQDPAERDEAEFRGFHRFLERSFPLVHRVLWQESPGGHALLFTWEGRDPALAPLVFLAHMDVVPVEPGTETDWTQPPFAGRIADGYVWGRGALDDKAGLMALLEAVEALVAVEYRPRRTIFLSFGHDEEVGGLEGARRTAALLERRGVEPLLVVDEGGFLAEGMLEGLDAPVALIGIGEKGYVNVELSVRGTGGHSSVPPRVPAAAVLGRALHRLGDRPMPARLGPAMPSFEYVAPEMGLGSRIVFANRWLTAPLIRWQLAREPTTAALMRTTAVPTMLQGSAKENVLPLAARALVNVRILPGDSVEGVIEHVRRAVDDPRVELRIPPGSFAVEPPPISPAEGPVFDLLARTVRSVYPEALVAPYILLGATDSRHFTALTPHVYRFRHARLGPDDPARIHGTDERIAVEDHLRGIGFWRALILALDTLPDPSSDLRGAAAGPGEGPPIHDADRAFSDLPAAKASSYDEGG